MSIAFYTLASVLAVASITTLMMNGSPSMFPTVAGESSQEIGRRLGFTATFVILAPTVLDVHLSHFHNGGRIHVITAATYAAVILTLIALAITARRIGTDRS
jgi:hypothetical protein